MKPGFNFMERQVKKTLIYIFIVFSITFFGKLQAQSYTGDGAWAVFEPRAGMVLIFSLNIYREDPGKGVVPTFMVNYNEGKECFVSLGLSLLKDDFPPSLRSNVSDAMSMLKGTIEQSDFLADRKLVARIGDNVQVLDFGVYIYARALINADTVVAFMMAEDGTIRINSLDSEVMFNMSGFGQTMSKILDMYCT